jgi:hypothetical protein
MAAKWAAVTFGAGLTLLAVALRLGYGGRGDPGNDLLVVGLLGFVGCGVIVVLRADGHPIGWLFLASGTLGVTVEGFGALAIARGPDGLGLLAGWAHSWLWLPASFPLLTVGFLVFPTGRLLSPRWRIVAWAAVGLIALLVAVSWLSPGPFFVRGEPFGNNPLALPGVEAAETALSVVAFPTLVLLTLASAASLVLRFRRASGVERLQLKWFAAAAAAFTAAMTLSTAAEIADLPGEAWLAPLFSLAFLLLPVAATVAILRHGLYQIDRIISRTLAYATLTALLIGVYTTVVMLASRLVGAFGGDSDLAVAVATLVAAAVFTPARRRIQTAVDRRFNRAHYDAERVVAAFREQLRAEVDLDDVVLATRSAAVRTMAPTGSCLWLRPPQITR